MRSLFLAVLAAASPAFAQCVPQWDTRYGTPGIADGYAGALINVGGRLYMGGSFSGVGGGANTGLLAQYDYSQNTWSAVGGGLHTGSTNGFVTSFAEMTNGIIIGGFFHDAANVADTKSIVHWDYSAFHPIITGWNPDGTNAVWSLLTTRRFGGEKVFIGGGFDSVNGQPAANLAVWDGTTSTPLVTSMTLSGFNALVTCMAMFDDGRGGGEQLYVGGRFDSIAGVTARNLARYNGTAWSAVGTNLTTTIATGEVDSLKVWDDGSGPALYIGGSNMRVNGTLQQTAKWNGVTWTAVGQNPGGRIWSLEAYNDGRGEKLYAGGTAASPGRFIRLENNVWVPVLGGVDASVFKLLPGYSTLYVAGSFTTVNGQPAHGIAAYGNCPICGTADWDGDGDVGTDRDIETFFRCLAGDCPGECFNCTDFNGDGDNGTDQDIEAFFRVLAGNPC